MSTCDRCRRFTATTPYADGAAAFCAACTPPQGVSCAPNEHDWHGKSRGRTVAVLAVREPTGA